jgi:hypothetical protein
MQRLGFWVLGLGLRVEVLGFSVEGLVLRAEERQLA